MQSHFGMMLLFSAFVSLAFAVLLRDTAQEQVSLGAMLFAGFVGVRHSAGVADVRFSPVAAALG